jgi:DNA-binding SARP family transcriptional activator
MAAGVRPQPITVLWTLGQTRVCGDAATRLSGRRKALALLVYLARHASRDVPRERLSRILWGDRDDSLARQSLRQVLLELRRAIGDGVEINAERVRLHRTAVELDATRFEDEVAGEQFEAAVARWHGDFLGDMDDVGAAEFLSWLEPERERLRRQLIIALSQLNADAVRRGDWTAAAQWSARWSQVVPGDEAAHRHWMHTLRMTRRSAEAAALHAAFVARWRVERDDPLAADLVQLTRQLEDDLTRHVVATGPSTVALCTPEFVGRDAELAELISAWEGVRGGSQAVVLIEGDRGIGKTRLCREFLRHVTSRRERAVVLGARSGGEHDASMTAEPFAVARELLHDLRDARGLAGAAPRALAELARVAPWVYRDFSDLPETRGTNAALVDGVGEALAAVADECPAVLFIDDVSQADAATLALVSGLAHALPRRILLVLTTRCDAPRCPELAHALSVVRGARRLKLQPLPLGAVEGMLASMIGMREEERIAVAARLWSDTGGNPFYVVELVSALADQQWLVTQGAGRWRIVAAHSTGEFPIPSSVRAAIIARLSRLGASARRIVALASALDVPFGAEQLLELSDLPPADLAKSLDELVDRRLLRHTPARPGGLEFTQQLLRRVAAHAAGSAPTATEPSA